VYITSTDPELISRCACSSLYRILQKPFRLFF